MSKKLEIVMTLPEKDLPSGWKLATIGDIVGREGVFKDGDWVESKDQDPNGDVRLIQLADIGDGEYRDRSSRFLTYEKALELRCTFINKGDVLVARMPDPLGRACIFSGDKKKSVTVVDVCVVRPEMDDISERWLMYFINAPAFRAAVASLQSGSTRKRISRKNLAKISLPVPQSDEQKRIVAGIEKQFSRLDKAVDNLKRVKANLKRYKATVLKAAVEGKLIDITKDSESFHIDKWQTIDSALLTLDQGWSPKCDRQKANESEWGVIKTSAVQTLQFIECENKRLPKSLNARQHLELQKNDLLVTRAGPRKRVGVCGLVRDTRSKLILCDKVYRLRCNPEVVRSGYLELVLNAPQIQKAINEIKTGISDSGVNLTQKGFKKLKIPLPSVKLQVQIESEVQRLWSIADSVALNTTEGNVRCQRLRQSILKKAFSGKLIQSKE